MAVATRSLASSLLDTLDAEQRAAAALRDGPAQIIAPRLIEVYGAPSETALNQLPQKADCSARTDESSCTSRRQGLRGSPLPAPELATHAPSVGALRRLGDAGYEAVKAQPSFGPRAYGFAVVVGRHGAMRH